MLADDGDGYWSDSHAEGQMEEVEEGCMHHEGTLMDMEPSSEGAIPLPRTSIITTTPPTLRLGEAGVLDPSTATRRQPQGIGGWFSSAIRDIWH